MIWICVSFLLLNIGIIINKTIVSNIEMQKRRNKLSHRNKNHLRKKRQQQKNIKETTWFLARLLLHADRIAIDQKYLYSSICMINLPQ